MKYAMAVLERLVRRFNEFIDVGAIPRDWRGPCIVPLYNGKRNKYQRGNSRGISLLCVVVMLYGRALIKRVMDETVCAI